MILTKLTVRSSVLKSQCAHRRISINCHFNIDTGYPHSTFDPTGTGSFDPTATGSFDPPWFDAGAGVVPVMVILPTTSRVDIIVKLVTFVAIGTFLLSAGTCLAVKLIIAFFIEDAVIIGLLKGEPLAILNIIALLYAFLKGDDGKRVHEVSLALECTVTFSGRTPELKE